MAGSAGSPPTFWRCKKGHIISGKTTMPMPGGRLVEGSRRHCPYPCMAPTYAVGEYVPREQSDALLRQADRIVSLYFEFESLDDQTLAHVLSEDMDALHKLVEAYREATAGEGEANG